MKVTTPSAMFPLTFPAASCNAFSIGSTGSCPLANIAADKTSLRRCPDASTTSRTAIRFMVRVPVLSTHSTVAEPSISMAGTRRVSTRLRDIRQAPNARKIVRTIGNSSGTSEIASARPANTPFSQFPRVRP
jgi:hypothetical protein